MKISVSLVKPLNDLAPPTFPSVNINPAWKNWFCIGTTAILFVQDVVHIAVKFKARLLNPHVNLKLGPMYGAGLHHFEQLRSKYGKEDHFLRERDLNRHDKQNYDAVLHMISACPLLENIPGAFGTKCYVEIIQNVVDSYEDKSLGCISRIEKIWYANFFLRYWRKWIMLLHSYTLKNNFITHNCYMCVELNAHAIIVYALTIRDFFKGDARNFLPWMLGSQTCERMFRAVRSMSSIYSTVLNFSMLGLLRRLYRLDIQLTLQAELQETVKFPSVLRHRSKEGKNKMFWSPLSEIKDSEISEAVDRAKAKAKQTLQELGMDKLLRVHSVWENENTTEDLLAGMQNNDDDDIDNMDDYGQNDESDSKNSNSLEITKELWSETHEEVCKDIQSACNGGLVSEEASKTTCKTLQKLRQSLPVNKVKSDTIPLYTLKGHR